MESPPCWDRTEQSNKRVPSFPDWIFCFTLGREKSCTIWRQTLSPWAHNIPQNFQGEAHLWKSSNLQTYLSRVTEDRNHPVSTVSSALSRSDSFRLFLLSEKDPVLSLKIQHSCGLLSLSKWFPRYQVSRINLTSQTLQISSPEHRLPQCHNRSIHADPFCFTHSSSKVEREIYLYLYLSSSSLPKPLLTHQLPLRY